MGIPILNELHNEIKRLSAAGSILAYGDFGLKKLLPSLKKMGEGSPVFSKLASRVEELTMSSDASEEKLLELLSLVNAILYTQGDWEAKGDMEELELIDNDGTTSLGYRKLRPIIDALTTKGPGRYSIISDAYNEGVFNKKDKRLILPIVKGLEDIYFEIPEYIIENIIPLYGRVMLPVLKSSMDLYGGKADGRKLKAIHKLSGSEEMELYKLAVAQGSAEVKLSAIEILNNEKAPNSIFEELMKDKKKNIREAAEAVLESRKTGGMDKLFKIFGNLFR